MNALKGTFLTIGVLVVLAVSAFGLEWAGIAWSGYFGPKKANVQREIYEESKSYVHGSIDDLARYYKEYTEAPDSSDSRQAIATVIQSQFASFDAEKISSYKLKQFLIEIRGY